MSFRRVFRPHKLSREQDIFHEFQWPPTNPNGEEASSKVGGRPRFKWTAQMSLHLIILIIHTDMKFDDIAVALKDDSGDGPSKTTWRNHWHEIFGYDPSVARLSDSAAQRHRTEMQATAYRAFRREVEVSHLSLSDGSSAQSHIAASSGSSTTPATYPNTSWATEQFDDNLIYSQEFIYWIKQSGLHVGLQELAGPHSSRFLPDARASTPSRVNQSTQTSICCILESCRATDDHLPSMTTVVEELLANGVTPNQTNARGESLLHLAVALGHIPIVTLLLEYSADPHLKTSAGESVWQFGAKASQKLMLTDLVEGEAPDLLARTMACARIEFARSTVQFNPNLIVNRSSRRKDRRGHRQVNLDNSRLEWPEWMHQHTTRQELMVNPIVEQGQYWDVPNHFNDLYFFSGPGQFKDSVLDDEPDLAWQ